MGCGSAWPWRRRWSRPSCATVGLQRALAPLVPSDHFWQESAAFDLSGISLNLDRLVIDPDIGLLSPGMGLAELRQQFRPDYQIALYHCAVFVSDPCLSVINRLRAPEQRAKLARNWLRAIVAHPRAYLAHRSNLGARILRLGGLEKPRRFYYLDAAPHHPLAGVYHPPPRTLRILAWLDLQQTWTGFAPWIYALGSCLFLPVGLIWYLRGGPILPLLFTASGLSYLLSVLLTAGGPDIRYTGWTVLCTLLALASALLHSWERVVARVQRWRGRRLPA